MGWPFIYFYFRIVNSSFYLSRRAYLLINPPHNNVLFVLFYLSVFQLRVIKALFALLH